MPGESAWPTSYDYHLCENTAQGQTKTQYIHSAKLWHPWFISPHLFKAMQIISHTSPPPMHQHAAASMPSATISFHGMGAGADMRTLPNLNSPVRS